MIGQNITFNQTDSTFFLEQVRPLAIGKYSLIVTFIDVTQPENKLFVTIEIVVEDFCDSAYIVLVQG